MAPAADDKTKDTAKDAPAPEAAPAAETPVETAPAAVLKDDAFREGPDVGATVGRVLLAPEPKGRTQAEGTEAQMLDVAKAGDIEEWVILDADLIEEFYADGAKRPSHRILFTKGQRVKKSLLEEMARNSEFQTTPA